MGRTERLAQPRQFGKYELIARLARGPMGDVFKAKSHGLEGFEKTLVIKVIHPGLAANQQFIDLLVAEAQKITALAHANIAQVYDLGREETTGQFYIAGEYVAGFDLARTRELRRMLAQPQQLELSVFIASEVAKALDYAHRRKDYNFNNLNLIHRHLAPENILLSYEGEVKVTDFGISSARAFAPALGPDDEMRKYLYASPEVARGEPNTQQSDVFSLGLVLYEMLSGAHPYWASDQNEVRARACEGSIAPLTEVMGDIPRQLTSIVDSMLVPDPAGRAANAGAVYEDLVGFIFGNNLRADTRALSLAMQELRREEHRLQPDEATMEVGMEEISLSEFRVLEEHSDPSVVMGDVPASTNAELPSHKLQSQFFGEERPPLPGALEEFYNSARAGRGKAVLVDGPLGSGRQYLPDRLVDALGWRGNTRAFSLQTTVDDPYIPFRVLTDVILQTLETPGDPAAGIAALTARGVEREMIDAFRSVVGLGRPEYLGKALKRRRLAELGLSVLQEACAKGPLVISIDRVERLDKLSLDAIRDIVGGISEMSLMLVMCTGAIDQMRSAFDIGQREALEAVRVVGTQPPTIDEIRGLTVQASVLLMVVGLAGQPFSQNELGKLTGFPQDQIGEALRELSDLGVVRFPTAGTVLAGIDELPRWAQESFTYHEIEQWASSLARHFRQRALQLPMPNRWSPLLARLHAYGQDRRSTLAEARAYAAWLEHEGWIHAALEFYDHVARLIADNRLGSPQARVEFLLLRAELALELSQVDLCRATLAPITALSEAARHDSGATRAQLLLGQLALAQDDLEEARQHFKRAAEAARSVNDPDLLAYALLSMARWHDRFGDAVGAQQSLERAMNLYNRWGTFRMDLNTRALLLNRAVRMLSRRGLHTAAKRLSDDLQELASHTSLPMALCRADWAQAALFIAESRYGEARTALHRADARAAEHGLVALRLELLRERAVAALSDSDYQDVVDLCDELLVVAREHQDSYSEQRAGDLHATASCLLNQNIAASVEHLQYSLARAHERKVPKDIYRCHLNLDRALTAIGNATEAADHRSAAERVAIRMRYHVGGR